jgi:hypothetical protein
LFDVFPARNGFKQGEALPLLLLNFSLEYTIRRAQVNQDLEIKWYTSCEGMDRIVVAQDGDRWRALVNAVMNLRVP